MTALQFGNAGDQSLELTTIEALPIAEALGTLPITGAV